MTASAAGASIHAILCRAFPRDRAKHLARAADAPLGTARAWASGRFIPSAETLMRMAERDERLADALMARLVDARARRAAEAQGKGAAPGGAEDLT